MTHPARQLFSDKTKTRTIAGHKITLKIGQHYTASRPMCHKSIQTYPVSIRIGSSVIFGIQALVIPDLTYDQANELINALNNGPSSFDGRDW